VSPPAPGRADLARGSYRVAPYPVSRGGLPVGLAVLGLALLLVGVGAAIVGRARWAFIVSRKVGGAVAAVGLVMLVVGAATSPPTAPAATSSDSAEPSTQPSASDSPPASPTDDEAAIEAAEESLAAAEESASPEDVLVDTTTGWLSDNAARNAVQDAERASALAALAAVEVKGRAPRTGYDRDQFGSGWVDVDNNGCVTRNDILARDLDDETFKPGTPDCVVLTGTLADPYSGRTIGFRRGQDTSDDVQIDHVVALSDAWQKAAQGFNATRRTAFANDPLNLLAVDGPLNMAKGDGDAATGCSRTRATAAPTSPAKSR
jgi:hypothetical protein